MRQKISFLTVSLLIFGLFAGLSVLAQEDTNIGDEITAEDLGISEPKVLPDNFFYFFKNFWRGVRLTFTFDPVKKAELQLRHANERLIEAKKMAEKTNKEEFVGKAVEKYQKEMDKLQTRVEKFEEKAADNPKIESFLDRFTNTAMKQQVLMEKLEEKISHNPKALEKIKEAKEQVLENHSQVIERLEDKDKIQERLEKNIQEMKQENMPTDLEQKMEQAREKIRQRVEAIQREQEQEQEQIKAQEKTQDQKGK